MKILFIGDKDYDKIIDRLSDDDMFKELLELFQESVVIPADVELIPVNEEVAEQFKGFKNSDGSSNDQALAKLIDVYWSSWD